MIAGGGVLVAVVFANMDVLKIQRNVAQVEMDFAALRQALENYQLDNAGVYPFTDPLPTDLDGYGNTRTSEFLTLNITITTPIAYMASYPTDPFKNGAVSTIGPNQGLTFATGNARDEGYPFIAMQQAGPNPGDPGLGFGLFPSAGAWQDAFDVWGFYRLSSIGPGQAWPGSSVWPGVSFASISSYYDPTNGTGSFGLITMNQNQGASAPAGDFWSLYQ